jgi:hypothetical protein
MLNRDAWNKFTPEQKKIHMKYAAWMSAKVAIGYFLISTEDSLQTIIKEKGVTLIKVNNAEFDQVGEAYKQQQRTTNIATAKGFGVKEPEKIIDTYEQLIDKKWRALSKEVGRDIDKFTDVLNREVFNKIDINKL